MILCFVLCVVVMDDDVLNMPNWGYYEPFRGGHLGLQLMPGIIERDTKPFLPGREPAMLMGANGTFHPRDCAVSEAPMPLNYVRDNWINPRHRFFNMQQPTNPSYDVLPETSGAPNLQIIQPPDSSSDEKVDRVEEVVFKKEGGQSKKRQTKGASLLSTYVVFDTDVELFVIQDFSVVVLLPKIWIFRFFCSFSLFGFYVIRDNHVVWHQHLCR
ncbi:hypothetical protein AAZX31_07G094000 [Glycine max]